MEQRYGRRIAMVIVAVLAVVGAAPVGAAPSTIPLEPAPVLLQLGDSVAAGTGLPLIDRPTDEDAACGRSSQAYVHYVAQVRDMQAINLACSGATTWNGIITDQETDAGELRSQMKQAWHLPRPDTVVMTVGANDVRWMTFLRLCVEANCATETSTRAFRGLLAAARAGVISALTGIQALQPSQIVVTGYYDPFAGSGMEPEQLGFTAEEVDWYQARLAELNGMLERAAGHFASVEFVAIDLSQQDGQVVQDLDDPAPFHPTAEGQIVIGRTVAMVIQS